MAIINGFIAKAQVINTYLHDCIGLYDAQNNLLLDGPQFEGRIGLVTPYLETNEICSYSLRTIIDLYPYFSYRNGTDLQKACDEFQSELLKLRVDIYNNYNEKLLSKYSQTILKFSEFDTNDFSSVTTEDGEKFYYMTEP